jgi:hypothetical protein
MIGLLIAKFASMGLPESVRRPLAVVSTGLALAALCGLLWTCWLRSHDSKVVEAHELEIAQEVAEQIDQAEHAAVAADQQRQAAAVAIDAANRKAIDDASAKKPESVRGAAGPAVNAVADRLRARTGKTGDAAR